MDFRESAMRFMRAKGEGVAEIRVRVWKSVVGDISVCVWIGIVKGDGLVVLREGCWVVRRVDWAMCLYTDVIPWVRHLDLGLFG
jgi:hypothetical protein